MVVIIEKSGMLLSMESCSAAKTIVRKAQRESERELGTEWLSKKNGKYS